MHPSHAPVLAARLAIAGAALLAGCVGNARAQVIPAATSPPHDQAQARSAAGLEVSDFSELAIGQTRWLPAREARQSTP